MREIRLAKSLFKMMFKDRLTYPGRLFVDTFTVTARFGVLILLYKYMFEFKGGEINGTTFQIAVWSMYLYFLFMTLRVRYVANTIMENVSSGKVADLFVKPINYLLYRSYWQIGMGLYSFFLVFILGVGILIPTIGLPETMNSFFLLSFLVIFCTSLVLGFFLYIIVGLLAFWIEDVKPIFWIVDKMVMILGGSYIPVALFPEVVYKFAVWSPFGASQFITHTVYESWRYNFINFLGIQLFWIVILGSTVYILFKKAQKRVSVNGG